MLFDPNYVCILASLMKLPLFNHFLPNDLFYLSICFNVNAF